MKPIVRVLMFLVVSVALFGTRVSASELYADSDSRQRIDFRLFYPISLFEDQTLTRRQLNFAGFDATYYFLWNDFWGVASTLGAWFMPVRDLKYAAILYNIYLLAGPSIRPFPNSYFDPTLSLLAGASGSDAGNITKMQANFPIQSRLGVNLFRETEKYQDNSLALCLVGSAGYVANQLPILKPWYFDFGLTFTGSF